MTFALQQITRSETILFTLLLMCLLATGCKKTGEAKDTSTLEEVDDTAMLEEPVDTSAQRRAQNPEEELFIPTAERTMRFEIDGDDADWKDVNRRDFDARDAIMDGQRSWKSKADASMNIGAVLDSNYLYALIEVRDDKILRDGEDSIRLWLRDPKLEQIMSTMPEGISIEDDLIHDVALEIRPDGSHTLMQDDVTLPEDAVTLTSTTFKGGWRIEAAIALETLPFVASLPLSRLAFRVDMHDSDKKGSDKAQTILSMMPYERDEPPRFAAISTEEGLLPHLGARGVITRVDGVGYWRRDEQHWTFTPLERVPKVWRNMTDTSLFFNNLSASLECPSLDQKRILLEAYTTRSERHRIGLMLCSESSQDTCPEDARTNLYWIHLARNESGEYDIKRNLAIFKEPIAQCRTQAAKGEVFHDQFATLPLDFVNANVWVVSWREQLQDRQYESVRHVIQFVSAKSGELMGNSHALFAREDDGTERVETINTSYFIDVDDEEGLDLCEIERHREQDCQSHQRGCTTRQRGETTMTHIKLWNNESERYVSYALRRHDGCPANFDLTQGEGYLLFHTGTRVGLLPSILNKDD